MSGESMDEHSFWFDVPATTDRAEEARKLKAAEREAAREKARYAAAEARRQELLAKAIREHEGKDRG